MCCRLFIPFLAAALVIAPATLPGGLALSIFGLSGSAEAATVKGSKSNNIKSAADCKKAGGTWTNGQDGLGCYLPKR